jgi:hypothetical protein
LLFNISGAQEKEEEDTYSISLVQTAEVDKEIIEVEDKKVLTETYTVEKGDHIWQLFRERGLLRKRNLRQLLSMLQTLNKSLTDLDLIYPDQEIIIPLVITPIGGEPKLAKKGLETPIPPEVLKDVKLENYTIRPGDTLVKVIRSRYDVPDEELYDQYLQLVKGLNPSIEDLDTVYPGQIVRLPIWTPQIVRLPVRPTPSLRPRNKTQKAGLTTLSNQLGQIFTQIGEEWVQTGDHFIPLKSGGHINLKVDSFPIISLFNGYKVIVDLNNDLPEKMTRLIESSWENYKIVHLNKDDNLRTAFNKILPACQYTKIYKLGEPLELGGDISLRITGDWIIKPTAGPTDGNEKMIMITFVDDLTPKTPRAIKDFLRGLGIKAIDYPPADDTIYPSPGKMEVLRPGDDKSSLIEMILNLTGQPFSRDVEIPIYKSGKTDFNLIIKAGFFLKIDKKDCIIDLTGFSPDVIALLEEHQFSVLALANEKNPSSIVSKTLGFLGVQFDSKPHDFMAAERDELKNIRLTIPGIIFQDNNGQRIFATHLRIPEEIAIFLSQRGYSILSLTLS